MKFVRKKTITLSLPEVHCSFVLLNYLAGYDSVMITSTILVKKLVMTVTVENATLGVSLE